MSYVNSSQINVQNIR